MTWLNAIMAESCLAGPTLPENNLFLLKKSKDPVCDIIVLFVNVIYYHHGTQQYLIGSQNTVLLFEMGAHPPFGTTALTTKQSSTFLLT